MNISDNVLREYLKNVYFVAGTACGGKSTITRALGERYGIPIYDADAEFDRHQGMSDPADQPAMNMQFSGPDEFFLRPYREYAQWLRENTRQQLDFVLMDLIRLSASGPVIFDGHLTVEEARRLSVPARVVFLIRRPENIIDDYCGRPGHEGFTRYIHSATDPEKARENCGRTLEYLNRDYYEAIRRSGFFHLERDVHSTVENTVEKVARHFGFIK